MKTILEKNYRISHNEDRFTQEYPFHSHDFYEIYFFAGGSVTYYIESKSYHLSEGDILIIPPRTLHRAVIDNTNASYDRYVLWIYNSCLTVNLGIKCFLEDIHEELSLKNTLLHQFKEYTKTTIHQYILMKRINLAKDYLESGFSPTSIYEKCGFSTYSNFYKAFTGQTGISPGNYKR
ncbi:MAG: AraC family transcriptional regulator [Lachnospiraceae bacterium]|nr:AraC family transcriptional regulator [Lachnospiraceae bacterium]